MRVPIDLMTDSSWLIAASLSSAGDRPQGLNALARSLRRTSLIAPLILIRFVEGGQARARHN